MKPLLSGFIRSQRFKAAAPYIRGDVLDIGGGNAGILAFLDSGQNYIGIEGHPSIFRWLEGNLKDIEFHQRDLDKNELWLEQNGLRIDNYRRFLLGGNHLFVCLTMGSPAE